MLLPKYKFYINSIEVKPIYNKLSKKYEQESNEYFFRESIEGTIKLIGTDFWLIANSGIEQELNFVIKKWNTSASAFVTYYSSNFSKTDCKLDFDKHACTFKLDKHDRYSDLMDRYEDTVDLIKYGLRTTPVRITKRGLIQVYISNNSRLSNFIGGGIYWEQDCESTNSYDLLVNRCGFSRTTLVHSIRVSTRDNSTGDIITLGQKLPGIYTGYVNVSSYGENAKIFAMTYKFMNSKYRLQAYIDFRDGAIMTNIVDGDGNDLDKPFNGIFDNATGTKIYELDSRVDLTGEEKELYLTAYKFKLVEEQTAVNEQTEIYLFIPSEEYIYARLLCDVPSVAGITAIKIPSDDIVENSGNYKYAVRYAMDTIYVSHNFTYREAPYGNNSLGQYYLPPSGIYGTMFFPVNRSYWPDGYSIWFDFGFIYPQVDESSRKQYVLKDGYFIADVIKCILKRLAPDIKHEATTEYSEFLYSSSNPLGLAKFYIFLTQKTNILKGEYDKPAQKAEITFKELAEMLYNCFKLRWFIDSENRLRIEHISWFMNGRTYSDVSRPVNIDLTVNSDYRNLKALAKYQNTIEYDKNDLAAHFEFSWMDDCTPVFEGTNLDVEANYIDKSKDESITVSKFTPDIDYMLAEPSNFSNDGFALLCAVYGSTGYELPFVTISLEDVFTGTIYNAIVQNGYATWLYLFNFYMFDMPGYNLKYDYLAPNSLIVRGIKRCMQQKVAFPYDEDPDVYDIIKTERGNGVIDTMSVNLVNRQVDVTLNFTPS